MSQADIEPHNGLRAFDTNNDFDAVVMLTWSDWKTEPRSNRYHYASRFAKRWPVLFLQPLLETGDVIRVESSELPGLDLVSLPRQITAEEVDAILDLLRARNIRKPLLWIYNCFHFGPLLRVLPRAFRVYHATEDYFTPSPQWGSQAEIAQALRKLLIEVDLLVGVSERVVQSYVEQGGYEGPATVSANGCDAEFFAAIAAAAPAPEENVCIFQGGINGRLDYDLLARVTDLLPDWTFRFCGKTFEHLQGWQQLRSRPNVEYLGALAPEAFAREMLKASVGIIPFLQEEIIWNSLPLKAYEYVACGLPVVSVPIAALQGKPELFSLQGDAEGFAAAIVATSTTRRDPRLLALRHEEAHRNSYENRFTAVLQSIWAGMKRGYSRVKRLNVCMLYDPGSVKVNTVREHLESFSKYSLHNMFFMPATDASMPGFRVEMGQPRWPEASEPDLTLFDAVLVHFCVRVCVEGHMKPAVEAALVRYQGLKALFIQDEYDTPEVARQWMERVSIDLVYTCVPEESVHKLYPKERFPWVKFLPTLTGYVPEDESIGDYALPIEQRAHLIGYRGRKLPPIYGSLGWEKYVIGREVRRLAAQRSLPVDVEVDDDKRIYGKAWYKFLGSARATLGTESGCNLFDWDGSAAKLIARRLAADPRADFSSMAEELAGYERDIRMNQVSPKIFESITTRTALVLFEGGYSGVVTPGIHYIPLKKDFSNFDEVVAFLRDDEKVRELTQRAYRDIIESGNYSYEAFIRGVDRDLNDNLVRGARVRLFSFPALGLTRSGETEQVPAAAAAGLLGNVLAEDELTREVLRRYASMVRMSAGLEVEPRRLATFARATLQLLPVPVRQRVRETLSALVNRHQRAPVEKTGLDRMLSLGWSIVPGPLKRSVRRLLINR